MIERASRHFGRLVFDRDAIVRAALRAYVETCLHGIARFGDPAYDWVAWKGDVERGALFHMRDWHNYVVVAWTESGIVGLAFDGWGPIQRGTLSPDAVTGGPDDVRWSVPGLPDDLEPALVLATSMLGVGNGHGERSVGGSLWLYGEQMGETLFGEPWNSGSPWLAAWGLLHNGRLLQRSCESHPPPEKVVVNHVRPEDAPAHAIIDAVVDRRLKGPTEFTPAEIETLLHAALDPEQLLAAQRTLQGVGITWPDSPELGSWTPQPHINGWTAEDYVGPPYITQFFGPVVFNRDAIVRAALRAYVETNLAPLDPLARHTLMPCIVPKWTGDVQRGAFFNGDGCGDYDVVAWTEAGVVGLAYKRGHAGIEQLGAALPGLPDELLPALEMAADLLEAGARGEKQATIGFWLHGDRTAGTLFDDPTLPGARRLVAWGQVDRLVPWGTLDKTGTGWLPLLGDRNIAALAITLARTTALPIHALIDAVTDRALKGPTELLPDELATLFPTPPDPEGQLLAQRMLQKVGIAWPGVPEMPEAPQRAGRSPLLASPRAIGRSHALGYLVFDRETIVRAALRAYVETTLANLDPLRRHPMSPACGDAWTGNLQRGAISGGMTVAWTETGVVGLACQRGSGPTVWIDLTVDVFAGGRDDVRRTVPDLPDELLPAFEMAYELFNPRDSANGGKSMEKMDVVGFWLCGDRVGGTLFDTPTADGVWRLAIWGRVGRGRLPPGYPCDGATITEDTFKKAAPFLAVVDAVVERALNGPTELALDEVAIILPKPPLMPYHLPNAQRSLQKVGITWPGSPEIA